MIEVGVAEAALGMERSGDRAVVVPGPDAVLIAAIDGLGHGELAAQAADAAAAVLEGDPRLGLPDLFRRCHEALAGTRGAVMTVARLHAAGTMDWAGIGNVEARLLHGAQWGRAADSPLLLGGILGGGAGFPRTPRETAVPLRRGDVVVMVTDGIRADFSTDLSTMGGAQAIADHVMARSGRGSDDALVLVARWLGPAAE